MILNCPGRRWRPAFAAMSALALTFAPLGADAQTAASKPVVKPRLRAVAKAPAKKALPPKIEYVPEEPASPEQMEASERVFYGVYDCEFKQTIDIVRNEKFPGFVDVRHAKEFYLMKPVLSSTGAIRLEDIRGETLMVQISSKSMLLNVKTARRLVDDCVSPRQRELVDAARAAKAAAAASAAENGAASAPATTSGLLRTPDATPR